MSGNYRYVSVVRLTMDDPTNENLDEGTILMQAGKCEDGVAHTVLDEENGDFVDVECEVLTTLKAEYRMGEREIERWAADQDEAKQAAKEARA